MQQSERWQLYSLLTGHTGSGTRTPTQSHTLTIAVALVRYVLGAIDVAVAEQLFGNTRAVVALPLVVQASCVCAA